MARQIRIPRQRFWQGSHDLPWQRIAGASAVLLLGFAHAITTGYLIVAGSWHVALGLILSLPALIVLHKYPFVTVLIWLAVAQFFVITPTMAERSVYWVLHRALPPATLGIIAVSHGLRINKRRLWTLGLPELGMAAYLATSVASIILLNNTPLATVYRFYDRVFSPLCLYLLIRLLPIGEKDLERLVPAAVFVSAAQSLIGVLSWVAPQALPSAWLEQAGERTTGSVINASTYTTTLVFCGLLGLQSALNRKLGLIRNIYLGLFGLTMFCVFLSFSRASWIGGLLAMFGLVFLYPKFMMRLGLVVVPAAFIGISIGLLTSHLSYANERLNSENTALDRLPAYYAAYLMFQEKPLFGWGYANFELFDRRFQGRVLALANDNKDHANHSAYLTVLAEQGAVGFTLFLAPVAVWLFRTVKVWPAMPAQGLGSKKLVIMLWLAMLNILVVNNFTPAWVAFGHGIWWLALGLIANMVDPYRRHGAAERPSAQNRKVFGQ